MSVMQLLNNCTRLLAHTRSFLPHQDTLSTLLTLHLAITISKPQQACRHQVLYPKPRPHATSPKPRPHATTPKPHTGYTAGPSSGVPRSPGAWHSRTAPHRCVQGGPGRRGGPTRLRRGGAVWARARKRSLGCVLMAVPAAFAAGPGSCVVHTCLQCSVLQCVMMNARGGAHTVKNAGGLRFP